MKRRWIELAFFALAAASGPATLILVFWRSG